MRILFSGGVTLLRFVLILLAIVCFVGGVGSVMRTHEAVDDMAEIDAFSPEERLVFDVAVSLDDELSLEFHDTQNWRDYGYLIAGGYIGFGIGLLILQALMGRWDNSLRKRGQHTQPNVPVVVMGAYSAQAAQGQPNVYQPSASPTQPVMTAPPVQPQPQATTAWKDSQQPIPLDDLNG